MLRLAIAVVLASVIGLVADISAASEPTETEIAAWQRAIKNNRSERIDALLAQFQGRVDLPAANGKTALMAAARQGDLDLAKRLLEAGAEVNARNQNGGTPLIFAAAGGARAMLALLLDAGAEVNAQASNGWTALMMAAVKNHQPALNELLSRRGDPNLADVYGWTPLMRAIYENRTEVVELLLARSDIDLETINDQGQTALHVAVIQRRAELTRRLLAQGATQRADFAGYTPLAIADELGDTALSALLRAFERDQ